MIDKETQEILETAADLVTIGEGLIQLGGRGQGRKPLPLLLVYHNTIMKTMILLRKLVER